MLALALGRATAMARAPAGLPAGIRLTDHISLGVVAKAFPLGEVRQVLAETGRASERERDLPAQVMVYYAIALALHTGSGTREVLRCLLEGLRWLWGTEAVKVAGRSGISQARTRLGEAPLRRLYEEVVEPIATRASKGASQSGLAAGQPGRLLPGRGRHRGEPRVLRLPGSQPRRERLPATALRGAGGERHARAVRRPPGPLRGRRDDAGPCGAGGAAAGHAVPGRPAVLRPRALAGGGRRRGPALAGEAQFAAAARSRAGRWLLPVDGLSQRQGPTARQQWRPGARGRIPAGGHCRGRAALPAGDHDPGPGAGARRGTGRALPRALGDRGRARRAEDAAARGAGRAAQQDPGVGPAGVLGPADGAFRRARADARSGVEGRRGSGPAVLLARGARGPPQGAAVRGASPLGTGPPCMRRCWRRSWRSAR